MLISDIKIMCAISHLKSLRRSAVKEMWSIYPGTFTVQSAKVLGSREVVFSGDSNPHFVSYNPKT